LYESLAFDNFAFAKLSRKCPHALLDLAVKEPARAAPQTVGCELYTSFLIQQAKKSFLLLAEQIRLAYLKARPFYPLFDEEARIIRIQFRL